MSKNKPKVFIDKINKDLFPYKRINAYKPPDMITAGIKARHGAGKKSDDYYAVLYCNYILLYKGKDTPTDPTETPENTIKLDSDFSYKLVREVSDRVVLSGLVPHGKKFTNTMGIGPEHDEWLLTFDDERDMLKFKQKTRKRCKDIKLFLRDNKDLNAPAIIEEVMRRVPKNSNVFDGPQPNQELQWIDDLMDLWIELEESRPILENLILFAEYLDPAKAPYLLWFTNAGSSLDSFEKELTSCEETFVQSWILRFKNFSEIDEKLKTMSVEEKPNLVQHCKYMIHLIDMYNTFQYERYFKDPEFIELQNKWKIYIRRIEGLIDAETLEIQQAEETKKAEKSAEEKKQQLIEQKKEEIKNQMVDDPLSSVNLYKTDDDPFADIRVLNMTDMYGNLESETWTNAPMMDEMAYNQFEKAREIDDYYDSLLNELDEDFL